MDTLAKRILDALSKYHKEFTKGRILKTTEEVEANTNPENVASALVTGELINNLGDCHIVTEGSGADTEYYIQKGADSASKKALGSVECTLTVQGLTTISGSDGLSHIYRITSTYKLEIKGGKAVITPISVNVPSNVNPGGNYTCVGLREQYANASINVK